MSLRTGGREALEDTDDSLYVTLLRSDVEGVLNIASLLKNPKATDLISFIDRINDEIANGGAS